MTKPTTKAMQDAYALGSFSAQRAELRKLVSPIIMTETSAQDLGGLIDKSPICGEEANQMKLRPTWSAFRDALDLDTLAALCMGSIVWTDVSEAIQLPTPYGVEKLGSKTGYAFGRPHLLDKAMVDANNAVLMGHATPDKPVFLEGQFGLQDMVDMHDHCLGSFRNDSDDLFDTMRRLFGSSFEDKIKATFDMVSIRSEPFEKSNYADLDGRVKEACRYIVDHMNDDDDEEIPEDPSYAAYAMPTDSQKGLIDLALGSAGLPDITSLITELNEASDKIAKAVATAEANSAMVLSSAAPVVADGKYPSGKIVLKVAADVFGITGRERKNFGFKIPTWDWDAPHPLVPAVDANYIFRPKILMRALYAIISNQPAWLHGHTGTGKTTLLEQIAARTFYPFMRINFDSEVSRSDLLGRDVLVNEGGTTTSKFVEGVLPQMLKTPCIACYDEADFMRPDIAYVMQRKFEGGGLVLAEDGGRLVMPHPAYRAFATGNTVGQGDEFGMYQGARVQSMAFLNRFKVWVEVDYMSEHQRRELIKSEQPSIKPDVLDQICKYITEHLEAFTSSKVLQPISPRTFLAFAQAFVAFQSFMDDDKKAMKDALEMTILGSASMQDKAVLKGISNRTFK
jgi:cobaltochelatase CobS